MLFLLVKIILISFSKNMFITTITLGLIFFVIKIRRLVESMNLSRANFVHQMQFLFSEGYTMYTTGIPPPSNHCRLHFGDRQHHLDKLLKEYINYYNQSRSHLFRNKDSPLGRIYEPLPSKLYSPNAIPVLGGLHHVYRWHTTSK